MNQVTWAIPAWVAGSLLACGVSVASDETIQESCQQEQYASVDIGFTAAGRPYVPVSINGQSSRMWLEAGSGVTSLYDGVATRLGLKTLPLPSTTNLKLGSKPFKRYAILPNFKLGTIALDGFEMLLAPVGPLPENMSLEDVVSLGLLSPMSLLDTDVELDLAHGKMNLFHASTCKGVYWSNQSGAAPMQQGPLGDWYFDMELDGKKLQTKFITTSNNSFTYTALTKRLYGWDEKSPAVEVVRGPTDRVAHHYRAMSLTMPGLTVMNAKIALQTEKPCRIDLRIGEDSHGGIQFTDCYGVAPLNLGMGVLKQLRLYFAVKQKMLYFTAADATKVAAESPQPLP